MIEAVLIALALVAVIVALVRRREEEPPAPATMESGQSHLRGER